MRWLAVILALLGCGSPSPDPQLVDVQRADLIVSVEVTGELSAVDSTDVKPPAMRDQSNFKVSWLAPEGAELAAGAPLATFDQDELNHTLESLQSDVAEAQKRLDKRRDETVLARREGELQLLESEAVAKKAKMKSDVPGDLVAGIELRTVQLDNELAQMALEQIRASIAFARSSDAADLRDLETSREASKRRIEEVEDSLKLMALAAPRAGTVVYPESSGEKRKVSDSVYQTETVASIVGLRSMVGMGRVDEVDISRIAVAQVVTLRLDALPEVELHGTLATITADVQAKSYLDPSKVAHVEIAVTPTRDAALRPGMRFRGQIQIERIAGAVQVPSEAVFIAADGPCAYRETASGLERVHLVLGRRSTTAIEVTAGLFAGDRVSRVAPTQEMP